MSTDIFYFSGTGNSLAAARQLAEKLAPASLRSVVEAIQESPPQTQASCVGLVFPVYLFGLPRIVTRFCEQLQIPEQAYIFAVATCGGMPAGTLSQLKRILARRGRELAAGFVLTMPGNYTPLYGAPPEDKQRQLLSRAKERIDQIATAVRRQERGLLEKNNALLNAFFSGVLYRFGVPRLPTSDRRFWADEKCNHCGLCARVCPVANIRMENGRPVWLHHCEQCMSCLQWCPQEAIQFGKSTVGRKRYHHPEVTVKDFMWR